MSDRVNITLTTNESGDWSILSVNGKEFASGHIITKHDWIDLIRYIGCNIEYVMLSDEELERII
jgi:hypothetical protein